MFKNKGKIFKILFIIVFILILIGSLGKCGVSTNASVQELGNGNFVLDDNLRLSHLHNDISFKFDNLRIGKSTTWFTSNGLDFNYMWFHYDGDSYSRVYYLDFLNTTDSNNILSINVYFNTYVVNSVNENTWLSINWRFIDIFSSSDINYYFYNELDSTLFLLNDILSVVTDSDLYFDGWNDGYSTGYLAGVSDASRSLYDDGYSVGYSEGLEVAYDNGFTDGSSSGYSLGFNAGYLEGTEQGFESAYNQGFTDGEMSSETPYTFKALFLALYDVPLQTINGLLNWDFMGLNLKNFFYTMLTIGLCLFILKQIF